MYINSPKSRSEYISSLSLAALSFQKQEFQTLSFTDSSDSAKIVAGGTASFISGIPVEKQQDTLNSLLLAQLAANKAFDRERETESWYGKYKEVLQNVGWVLGQYNFERQTDSGTTIKLDTKSLQIVSEVAAGGELTMLTKTLDSLRGQSNGSKSIQIFDKEGSSGTSGNFQLGTATLDPNKNISLLTGAFYLEVDKKLQTKFLFQTYESSSIIFYAGVQRITLNEAIYSTIRQDIIIKLGDLATTYIADLPI